MNKFNLKNHVKQHFSISITSKSSSWPCSTIFLCSIQAEASQNRVFISTTALPYPTLQTETKLQQSAPTRDNWQNINALGFVVPSSSLEHNRCKVSSSKESFKISRPVTGRDRTIWHSFVHIEDLFASSRNEKQL